MSTVRNMVAALAGSSTSSPRPAQTNCTLAHGSTISTAPTMRRTTRNTQTSPMVRLQTSVALTSTGLVVTSAVQFSRTSYFSMARMNSIISANKQVRHILAQMPVAPTANSADTLTVNGVGIPAGEANSVAPSFTNQQDYIINGDYNIDSRQTLHARYLKSRTRTPSFGASFPQAQFA